MFGPLVVVKRGAGQRADSAQRVTYAVQTAESLVDVLVLARTAMMFRFVV